MNRLFRHDRLIAWNATRATFARWHDRVIAATMLLAALAIVCAWFADRPWQIAAWAALAIGVTAGIGAGRLVGARLSFHASDGVLAADALHPAARRRYLAAWHGVALALLALVTLIARPSLVIVSLPAYSAGVLLARVASGFEMPRRFAGSTRPRWTLQAWSHRPIAGVAAATILLVSALAASRFDANAPNAVVGIGAVLLALTLTSVDDGLVCFMTFAGHGSRRMIVSHAKGLAAFVGVAVPGCWAMLGPIAAGIIAAACAAVLLLLALRILAYRLHGKRFADILVSILAAVLMLVAYSVPVALPVVILVVLWHLQRRGLERTWLLA